MPAALARKNAGADHYLVVWDNGSVPVLREWLQDFAPDALILSENIGVVNAMRRVFGMYHDSTVVWCNDDLVYYPNWLQPQLDIFNTYPNVATVTGCVTRLYSGKADDATIKWAHDHAKMGLWDTPMQWDIQHGDSIGKKNVANMYANSKIPLVSYDNVKALIGGNHCQVVCNPRLLYPLLPRTDMYMLPLFHTLDMAINDKGYLRLMTPERLTRHIGNVMAESDKAEIKTLLESD